MTIETPQQLAASMLNLFGPDGKHWTQRALARSFDGSRVGSLYPSAVCWCLAGAMSKVLDSTHMGATHQDLVVDFFSAWKWYVPSHISMMEFNDTASWDEVKEVLEGIVGKP